MPVAGRAVEVPMIRFFAHFLFLLAAWTLVIKFAFPIGYALAEGTPLASHVMWDFWWVIHLGLGWSLLHWGRFTYGLALAVSVIEIVIIVTKFALFLPAPDWTIWTASWFVNKLFVLTCFAWLLGYLALCKRSLPSSMAKPAPNL